MCDLPEERYQASLMTDKEEENLYLFGGYGPENNEDSSILMINLQTSFSKWEKIELEDDTKSLLLRRNMATMKTGENSNLIYIIGGKNCFNEEEYDDVIIYDTFCRLVQISSMKLKAKTSFMNSTGVNINNIQFYFIDHKGEVIMINGKNHNVELITQCINESAI